MARFWVGKEAQEVLLLSPVFVDALDLLGDDVHVILGWDRVGTAFFSLDILTPEVWYLGWVVLAQEGETPRLTEDIRLASLHKSLLHRLERLKQALGLPNRDQGLPLQRAFVFFPKGRPKNWPEVQEPEKHRGKAPESPRQETPFPSLEEFESPRDFLASLWVDRLRSSQKSFKIQPSALRAFLKETRHLGSHALGALAYPAALLLESSRKQAFYRLDPSVVAPGEQRKTLPFSVSWWSFFITPPVTVLVLGAVLFAWDPALPDPLLAFGIGVLLGPLLGGFLLYLQAQGLESLQRHAWLLLVFALFCLGGIWIADPLEGWYTLYGFVAGGLLSWVISWHSKARSFVAGWAWGTLVWTLIFIVWALFLA